MTNEQIEKGIIAHKDKCVANFKSSRQVITIKFKHPDSDTLLERASDLLIDLINDRVATCDAQTWLERYAEYKAKA
jgi:hypothetical protein